MFGCEGGTTSIEDLTGCTSTVNPSHVPTTPENHVSPKVACRSLPRHENWPETVTWTIALVSMKKVGNPHERFSQTGWDFGLWAEASKCKKQRRDWGLAWSLDLDNLPCRSGHGKTIMRGRWKGIVPIKRKEKRVDNLPAQRLMPLSDSWQAMQHTWYSVHNKLLPVARCW